MGQEDAKRSVARKLLFGKRRLAQEEDEEEGEEEEEEAEEAGEAEMPEEEVADNDGGAWESEARNAALEQELYALLALQHMGALCIYDEQH